MGKHLTLDERMEIQLALKQGKSFNEIAEDVGKSRTTISREIRKHTVTVRKGAYGRGFNECVHRFKCKAKGICQDEPDCVTKNCRFCGNCNKVCEQFEKEICSKLDLPPYVCNGCENLSKCTLEKKMYEARTADKEYRTVLVESREGFNLSDGEFENIDRIASERIKNGQSICHILSTCKNEITCSESTLRRLVNSGALKARNIDMPRTVRFKPRKGIRRQKKIDRNCTVGRSYEDFKQFIFKFFKSMPHARDEAKSIIPGMVACDWTRGSFDPTIIREQFSISRKRECNEHNDHRGTRPCRQPCCGQTRQLRLS